MSYCGNCGEKIDGEPRFCPRCGKPLKISLDKKVHSEEESRSPKKEEDDSIIEKLNKYLGNNKKADLNWRVLFSDIFERHKQEDAERIFICGTKETTPHINDVAKGWPHPWLYSRVFLMFVMTFALLWVCCSIFDNTNTLPGLIVVGSFAVPLSTMVMFLEMNVYRNISFYQVISIFFIGGCASLVAALLLFSIIPTGELDYIGAILVGIIEETGKAVIVCYFINKMKIDNILGGLLVGASVGAGFAAFESAGYAMNPLLQFMQYAGYAAAYGQQVDGSVILDAINSSIFTRGFLAPGGHVAWASISGVALSMTGKKHGFSSWTMMTKSDFLRLFIIPVVLHAAWDCPFVTDISEDLFIGYVALCVAVWIVLLMLIDMGLAEVNKKKENKKYEILS